MNKTLSASLLVFGLGLVTVSASATQLSSNSGSSTEKLKIPDYTQESIVEKSRTLENLSLPPVTTEIQNYLDKLQISLDGQPQFSAVQLSEDRSVVTIWWHGEITEALAKLLELAPKSLADIHVEQTKTLSSNCTGVPGSDEDSGRTCSATIYSTEVWRILVQSGWSLQTSPYIYAE